MCCPPGTTRLRDRLTVAEVRPALSVQHFRSQVCGQRRAPRVNALDYVLRVNDLVEAVLAGEL